MQLQQMYDKIKNHLLTQNAQSFLCRDDDQNEYACAYRGDDGRMCAVGVLISDKAYDPSLEYKPWYSESVVNALGLSGIEVDSYSYEPQKYPGYATWINEDPFRQLLDGVQTIHDQHEPRYWKDKLDQLATKLGLVQ